VTARNHDADAPALATAPRVLLVGEAPPKAGLGPLGAFDCDSGKVLARLDPEHGGRADASRLLARQCVEDTLGLFTRSNLLAVFPGRRAKGEGGSNRGDEWPELEAVAAAREQLPGWAGRRVALAGRRVGRAVAKAGGFALAGIGDAPWCRWVELGGPGEPAAICVVPHPSPTNRDLNPGKPAGEALGRWLAGERRRLDREALWMRLDADTVYRYSDGAFLGVPHGQPSGTPVGVLRPAELGPAWRRRVLLELAVNCAGQGRFTGRGMGVAAHHLLVDEIAGALADHAGDEGELRAWVSIDALTHDLREGLTHDVTPFLKRRHPGLAADERRAAEAVDRLLGLRAPPAAQALVHRADVLVREVEAVALWGIPLGDVAWDRAALGDMSRWSGRVASYQERGRAGLVAEWSERLGSALARVGATWYQEGT